MTKKISEWLNEIADPQIREAALRNLKKYPFYHSDYFNAINISQALGNAFFWNNSKEGHQFWRKVFSAYIDDTSLPPYPTSNLDLDKISESLKDTIKNTTTEDVDKLLQDELPPKYTQEEKDFIDKTALSSLACIEPYLFLFNNFQDAAVRAYEIALAMLERRKKIFNQ